MIRATGPSALNQDGLVSHARGLAKEWAWTQTNSPQTWPAGCSPTRAPGRLGHQIEEARAGYARLSMRVRADMLNGHRIVHGGMVFALADTAFAYVCNGRNEKTVAAQASIVFLGSAQEGETLDRRSRRSRDRRPQRGDPRICANGDGRAIAEFTGYSRTLGGPVADI